MINSPEVSLLAGEIEGLLVPAPAASPLSTRPFLACAQLVGFDRSRNFYPIALIVIASYYELFAAMAGSYSALGLEVFPFAAFILLAVLGFRFGLRLVVAGIVAHGLSDAIHLSVIDNPGVPSWWPGFCMSIDLAIGAYAAVRISCVRRGNSATAHSSIIAALPKEQT